MAKKTTDQLKQEALQLGIQLLGTETYEELTALVKGAVSTPESAPVAPEDAPDLDQMSSAAQAALAAKPAPTNTEKMYSKSETMEMIKEALRDFKKSDVDTEDINEEDGPRKHTCRMARIKERFIVGLKNMNTDPFFPDRVVYSQDIFNDQTRLNVPHMTVILEDGQELTLPVETLFKNAKTIDIPLLERKLVPANQKLGQVEVEEMKPDAWSPIKTGDMITAKQKAWRETYVVQLPSMETPIEVIPDVVNW